MTVMQPRIVRPSGTGMRLVENIVMPFVNERFYSIGP
jgi:hypothetical protein